MPFYLGAFLGVALDWRAQARNAALQTQTLQALEARVAALEEENKTLGRQNEAYQASLKLAQEAKEEAKKQLGEAMELQADFYAREVMAFHEGLLESCKKKWCGSYEGV